MEFFEVINKRRTTREFLNKPIDFEIIKKILEAGNKAPTWNHNRNWQFIMAFFFVAQNKEVIKTSLIRSLILTSHKDNSL